MTARGRRAAWALAFAVVAVLLVIRNLSGLATAPVGSYVDETSIGYNAWAIATTGADEHGAHLPLYFTAFGEYKNPVYIYALSAVLRVLPLTSTTERLPAAMFGLLACLFLTLLAWRRTRSLPLTLLVLVVAALTPWLTIESRVGFEVVSMLAVVSAALWCLSVAVDRDSTRWYLAAGTCLAVAVYAYSTGRVEVFLFAAALVVALYTAVRTRRWMWTLLPVALAYVLLLGWNSAHPGALTARFNAISIAADGAAPLTVLGRFLANYLTYFGPDFLFVHGDANPRHATGFGGMVPWLLLPLLVAGCVALWRRRRQPYIRVLVLMTLLAPVSAALTDEGTPHSLRASVMLPLLIAVMIEGLIELRERLASGPWRAPLYSVALLAILVQGTLFTIDMEAAWPARSASAFDAGEIDAVTRAAAIAHGAPVLLSNSLDPAYVTAAFALRPPPPGRFVADSETPLLAEMGMTAVDAATAPVTGAPGTVAVLAATDPVPAGASPLFVEMTPLPPAWFDSSPVSYETIAVYRLR